MKNIKDLMKEFLGKEGMGDLSDLMRIREAWPNIMRGEKGKKTRPYRMEGNRLYIGVESHAWAQELHYDVEDIKKRIQEGLGIEIREVIIKKVNLK